MIRAGGWTQQVPSPWSFWETCTSCGLTPTHELILTNKPGETEREEGGVSGVGNCELQNMIYGVLCHYPAQEKFRICLDHKQCSMLWAQCFLIQDYPWSGLLVVYVLDKYETRGECYVKPREVWIESENQHQDPACRGRVNAVSHVKSDHRTVFILSLPCISAHNTEICGPSWTCSEPSDIQISEGEVCPIRTELG